MSKFGRVYLDACACVMPRLNRPSEIAMSKDTPNKISAVGRGTVSCALSLQRDDQTTKTAIRNMATPAHSDTAGKVGPVPFRPREAGNRLPIIRKKYRASSPGWRNANDTDPPPVARVEKSKCQK
jgi:hypothetical protein